MHVNIKNNLLQIILLVLSFLLSNSSNAQDLLVTNSNDSINCKILNMFGSYEIAYIDSNSIKKKTFAAADIKIILIDFYINKKSNDPNVNTYPTQAKTFYKGININKLETIQYPEKRVRTSLNFLYAFRYGISNSNGNAVEEQLIGQLRHNYGTLFNIHFRFGKLKKSYLGIQAGRIQGNASVSNVMLNLTNGQSFAGTAEMQVNISTIGANILYPIWHRNKNKTVLLNAGFNYIWYYEDFRISNFNAITQSNTIASSIGALYDFRINQNWGVGCGATIDGGILTDLYFDINGDTQHQKVDIDKGIGLGRITLVGGLIYYL